MLVDISKVKLTVTAPRENVDEIRRALGDAGTGIIGHYHHCCMVTDCIGSFIPDETCHPHIGTINELEYVEEGKIEVQCDVKLVREVCRILREVHPYEEVPIEIYPLIDESAFE